MFVIMLISMCFFGGESMRTILALVLILSLASFAFANYFAGVGGVGDVVGIVGGLTLTYNLADFGEGHTVLMGALGNGLGISANYTPFKIYEYNLGTKLAKVYLGAGAGLSFDLSGTSFVLGAGITFKTLIGDKFLLTSTSGYGIGGYYWSGAIAYIF